MKRNERWHGSARDKAFVGNAVRGNGRTRIVAGFVAGCAHVADAAGRDADINGHEKLDYEKLGHK
jgi:hypothetical protein